MLYSIENREGEITMILSLKTELKKAFNNKLFYLSLIINCIITIIAGIVSVLYSKKSFGMIHASENPWLPVNTLYQYWIADDMSSVAPYIFYVLLPLTACLAYGWSYSTELRSGYIKNVLIRTTRKNYYISKFIATFLSGTCVAFIPILLNILVVACFIPAVKPDIYYNFSYIHYSGIMLSKLFFTHPIMYLIAMTLLTSLFSGIYACLSLALSFFVKNKIAVTTVPFILLLIANYATGMFRDMLQNIGELSPLKFLHATTGNLIYLHNAIIELVVLFIITGLITIIRGTKNDVF